MAHNQQSNAKLANLDPLLHPQQHYPETNQRPHLPPPPTFAGSAPRQDGLKADGGVYQSPQPYYYPSPQTNLTPQQSGGQSAQHSNQTSPQAAFQPPAPESAGSPEGDGAEDAKRPRACEVRQHLEDSSRAGHVIEHCLQMDRVLETFDSR
jgi:hypothetical protein